MKRRIKRKLSVGKTKKNVILSNGKLILLVLSFITGVILGALTVKNSSEESLDIIKELTDGFVQAKANQSILNVFISYCTADIIAVILSAVFGLSVIGEPIILLIPCFRGLGLGMSIGCIYSQYNLDAIMFVVLMTALPACLSISSMLIACKENILNSKDIIDRLNGSDTQRMIDYRMYVLRNAITVFIILAAAVVGCLICNFFGADIKLG